MSTVAAGNARAPSFGLSVFELSFYKKKVQKNKLHGTTGLRWNFLFGHAPFQFVGKEKKFGSLKGTFFVVAH